MAQQAWKTFTLDQWGAFGLAEWDAFLLDRAYDPTMFIVAATDAYAPTIAAGSYQTTAALLAFTGKSRQTHYDPLREVAAYRAGARKTGGSD